MDDLERTRCNCRQPDQFHADDGREHHIAEHRDAGADHHDAEKDADPQGRRTQRFDAGPAVVDRHAILLDRDHLPGMITSTPRPRHPTKP